MESGRVERLRFIVDWSTIEHSPGAYDFSSLDPLFAGAAQAGVEPRPFAYGTPSWLASRPARPPVGSATERRAWEAFLTVLAERYGPGGSFWAGAESRAPVRTWQIWNEPNFTIYWRPRPSPREYATLLSGAADAIHGVDARARILLAGVAPVVGADTPWTYLRKLYRIRGVERDFDAIALHPYSPNLRALRYQLRRVRRAADRADDGRVPIEITELGWSSARAHSNFLARGERGQASLLRRSFELLTKRRRLWRIGGVDWYSWRDTRQPVEPNCPFCPRSGLFELDGEPKRSWDAYRSFTLRGRGDVRDLRQGESEREGIE